MIKHECDAWVAVVVVAVVVSSSGGVQRSNKLAQGTAPALRSTRLVLAGIYGYRVLFEGSLKGYKGSFEGSV